MMKVILKTAFSLEADLLGEQGKVLETEYEGDDDGL